MSVYKARTHDQRVADDYNTDFCACRQCGTMAERTVLVDYGGLCGGCYGRYVTRGVKYGPMPSVEARKAIVARLKAVLAGKRA